MNEKPRYIIKTRIPLKPNQRAPKGYETKVGPRGGKYYESDGKGVTDDKETSSVNEPVSDDPKENTKTNIENWKESLTPNDQAMFSMLDDQFHAELMNMVSSTMVKLATKALGLPMMGQLVQQSANSYRRKKQTKQRLVERGKVRADVQEQKVEDRKRKATERAQQLQQIAETGERVTEEPVSDLTESETEMKIDMIQRMGRKQTEGAKAWNKLSPEQQDNVVQLFTEKNVDVFKVTFDNTLEQSSKRERAKSELVTKSMAQMADVDLFVSSLIEKSDEPIKFDRPQVLYQTAPSFGCQSCPNFDRDGGKCNIVEGDGLNGHCMFWGVVRRLTEKLTKWETKYTEEGVDYNCRECERFGTECSVVNEADDPDGTCVLYIGREYDGEDGEED